MFCFMIIKIKYSTLILNLVSWLASLDNKTVKVKIIKTYLTDLQLHHIDIDYSEIKIEAFHHSILQQIIIEIWRLQNDSQTHEWKFITCDLLLLLLHQFNQSIIEEAIWHASFCLTFARLLCMSEFTWNQLNRTSDFRQ